MTETGISQLIAPHRSNLPYRGRPPLVESSPAPVPRVITLISVLYFPHSHIKYSHHHLHISQKHDYINVYERVVIDSCSEYLILHREMESSSKEGLHHKHTSNKVFICHLFIVNDRRS